MIYLLFYNFITMLTVALNLYNLKLVKLNYKDLIILSLFVIPLFVLSMISLKLGIPTIFIMTTLYLFIKNKKIIINIISVALSIILVITSDVTCGYLFLNIFNISREKLISNNALYTILILTIFVASFIVSKIIGIFLIRFNITTYIQNTNKKLTTLIVSNIIIVGVIMYTITMIVKYSNLSNSMILLTAVLFIFYFISTIAITIFYANHVKKDILTKQKPEEFNQLKEYTGSLEYMHMEMRKFKHDYINIISTLNEFIQDRNIDDLENYFNENIIPLSKSISNNNNQLGLLRHIKVTGLKGLISSKIVQAQGKNINVFLDIAEDITRIDMDIIDLCRVTGILFDNAIDAAINTMEPTIKFGIINRKNSIVIVIINSCDSNTPPIYKIFEKGFSTKGNNRGLGLSNVKEILNKKYSTISLNTSLKDQFFKQELLIQFDESLKEKLINYENA